METNVTVGNLLSTSLAIFIKRIPYLAAMALVVYLPQMIWTGWLTTRPDAPYLAMITFPLMMLGGYVTQGAITVATYRDLRGQGFQLGAGLSRALSRFLLLLGLSIASWFMILMGTFLLIVPGIMLQCALFVAVPSLMVEDIGIGGAISRSFELTSGYRLKIFALGLIAGIIAIVPVMILSVVLVLALGEESLIFEFFNTWISGIAGSAMAVASVVTYYRLREDVDGVGLEELDDVFA